MKLFGPTSFSRKNSKMPRTLQTLFKNHAIDHALFVARIMIGWLPPTNVPLVYKIIYSQPVHKSELAIKLVTKPTRQN